MRRGLEKEKDRVATKKKSKLTSSQDEVARWLGERLRAALGGEIGDKHEMTLMRDGSREPGDEALI
jgi:hypothetical protein